MKKILTVLLTATLVLSFAGCSGGSDVKEDNETATSVTEKATEPKTEEPTEKEKEATVQEKIEDYIIDNSDQFSAVKEQFKDVMDLDVSADDKTLIVQYTYLQDVGDAIDTDTIDETLDGSASMFVDIIDELKDYTDIEDPKLCVRYCNVDGTVLYEKIFDENYKPDENASSNSEEDFQFSSLQDYVESDVVQSTFDSVKEQFEGVMDASILAEGNNIVYQYKYLEQIPEEALELTKSSLKESFSTQTSTYEYVADLVEASVGIDKAGVVVRILNADNSVIYEEQLV